MRIALFEPDIPQNTGTILRLAACLGIEAHIIEPAGFPTSDRAFRRAGMDYLDQVVITRHASWEAFETWRRAAGARLVLFTTRASLPYLKHAFRPDDVLLFGREIVGVPDKVHAAADARLIVPMREGLRSLNVAMAAAMAVGEAMRQIGDAQRTPRESEPEILIYLETSPESAGLKSTRRVKDILTPPKGAAPHPPRSLALAANTRSPNPHASGGRHHTPPISPASAGFR